MLSHFQDNGNRPLHIAAQNGHTDIVQLLIKKKCSLNEKNAKGNTAIHMAVGYDYYDAAKLIIDAGGDPSIENLAGSALCGYNIPYLIPSWIRRDPCGQRPRRREVTGCSRVSLRPNQTRCSECIQHRRGD